MVMRRRRAFTGQLLAVALTTLAAGIPARAQVPVVGVYAGINRATFDGSGSISGFDARDEVNQNAFQLGAFGSFRLNRYLAINPTLGYSEMGTGLDRRNGLTGDVKLAYFEAHLNLIDRGNLRTRSLVWSGQVGAGIEVSRLFVEARYQKGLTSIDDSGEGLEIRNRVLAVVTGYGFRVGH